MFKSDHQMEVLNSTRGGQYSELALYRGIRHRKKSAILTFPSQTMRLILQKVSSAFNLLMSVVKEINFGDFFTYYACI